MCWQWCEQKSSKCAEVYLQGLREIKVERVTVVKFGMYSTCGDNVGLLKSS